MQPEICEAPDRNPVKPDFEVPKGATDCHAHVFNPDGPSLPDPNRSYSPSIATEEQFNHLHKTLGIDRCVIVQPSIYGTDNRTTMDVVSRYPDKLRAVVVVDQTVAKDELVALHKQGARGVRINMLFGSSANTDNVQQLCQTIQSLELGWHLQVLTDISNFGDVHEFVKRAEIPVVFDHMGHMPVAKGIQDPGFQAMFKLLEDGQCWVKLSGANRISGSRSFPYSDVDEFAKVLVAANSERLVWGSDWPHASFDGDMPNDGDVLNELQRWVPDESIRHRILVDNPARLYDF